MNLEALNLAIFEAKRFLLAAQAVRTEPNLYSKNREEKIIDCTKESAACKRASLDLTRALSELRKP